ncbi:hypothetical protein MTR_4g089180 [Medicago truncatula]|uniref:Uncharacterized protein n=1 Tax=Medicago truncatula TaxID=3880 RepID=A0A072UP23_MEDTR|nr:hypothetical protein MTR_4g089180 [Medicago truncatula]
MSKDYDYIKDLEKYSDIWKMEFGVLDSWIVTDKWSIGRLSIRSAYATKMCGRGGEEIVTPVRRSSRFRSITTSLV